MYLKPLQARNVANCNCTPLVSAKWPEDARKFPSHPPRIAHNARSGAEPTQHLPKTTCHLITAHFVSIAFVPQRRYAGTPRSRPAMGRHYRLNCNTRIPCSIADKWNFRVVYKARLSIPPDARCPRSIRAIACVAYKSEISFSSLKQLLLPNSFFFGIAHRRLAQGVGGRPERP